VGLCICVLAVESQRLSTVTLTAAFYIVIFFIGVCRAFRAPAVSALRSFLVPPSLYENATKWSTSSWQVAAVLGPSLSGFLYLGFGLFGTLLAVVLLLCCSWILFSRIGDKPVPATLNESSRTSVISSVLEGVRFAYRTKIIFYSISLDMLSVLFGGVVAILPIYAEDILHVGAGGLGILRAAPALGGDHHRSSARQVLCDQEPLAQSPHRHFWIWCVDPHLRGVALDGALGFRTFHERSVR